MTELEERIIARVAEERGMKPDEIDLTSRLSQDLGMDGDDAVDFFEKFSKDFNVDVAPLGHHWHQHFGPEVGGPSFGCIALIVPAFMCGTVLHGAFQPIPEWAGCIAFYLVFAWLYARFFPDRHYSEEIPVTVGDLVDAANAGKWVKHYEDNGATMFRTLL